MTNMLIPPEFAIVFWDKDGNVEFYVTQSGSRLLDSKYEEFMESVRWHVAADISACGGSFMGRPLDDVTKGGLMAVVSTSMRHFRGGSKYLGCFWLQREGNLWETIRQKRVDR